MNSRQVAYFLAVADAESFSGAAEFMHVSQSAISARIGELEQLLQARLFERGPRGVSLTAAGRRLLPHARAIAAAFDGARRAMEGGQPSRDVPVVIGVTPTIGSTLLPTLLKVTSAMELGLAWRAQQASTPRLLALLDAGELDAALCYGRYGKVPSPHVSDVAIDRHDLALVGARAMLGGSAGDVPFARLPSYGLVLDPASHPGRQVVDAAARRLGVELDLRAEIEPLTAKKMLVLDGALCTIVPPHVFGAEIASGACVARRIVAPRIRLTLRLLVRRSLGIRHAGLVRTAIRAAAARAREDLAAAAGKPGAFA